MAIDTSLLICACLFYRIQGQIDFRTFENVVIRDGALKTKSIRELQTGEYGYEASGAVENYSKWTLSLRHSEEAHGYETIKMRHSIHPGYMMGFAARHASSTAVGVWMRFSFVVDDDILLHFMYMTPYSDSINNVLAVAACDSVSRLCRSMDADKMYFNKYPFLERREYNQYRILVAKCDDNLCILGWMDSSHKPVVRIKVFPRSYYGLKDSIREKLSDLTKEKYDAFIWYWATYGS